MIALLLVPWPTMTGGSEPTRVPATMPTATAGAGRPLESPLTTPYSTSEHLESPVELPKPASQFCEEQGYRLEIRKEPSGSAGYCRFPDGSECED